MSGCKTDI